MTTPSLDSFKCRRTLKVGKKSYQIFDLKRAERNGLKGISKLPSSLKVLLENLLRHEDGRTVTKKDIKAVKEWGALGLSGLRRRACCKMQVTPLGEVRRAND